MPDNLNEKLLRLESLLLNAQPCMVTGEAMAEMTSLGIGDTMAYALLLASAFGLQPDADDADRRLVYDLLLPSVNQLDAAEFEDNDYYRNIRLPDAACHDVVLTTMQYEAYQAFPCGDLYFENNKLRAPLGFFRTAFRYPAITKGGREWMTVTPNEIRTMQTAVDAARGNVLVYGLGLGYFAYMAAVKDEVETLTVVDVDESVIELFKKYIWPQFPDAASRKIIVLQQDAFANAEQSHFLRYGQPYDLVFTDLWHDVGDGLPLYRRMRDLQDRYASPGQQFHYWIEPSIKCYE